MPVTVETTIAGACVADGSSPAGAAKSHSNRIAGLDSIRFICALWVVFGHLGFFPAVRDLGRDELVGMVLRALLGNLFSGPPAVIVFFIISGFCIHYPFRSAAQMPSWRFLLRRYIRIGVPAGGAVLFIHCFAPHNPAFQIFGERLTVVWSLWAEVIYYTIYPLLFLIAKRTGWLPVLSGAAVTAFVLIVSTPRLLYLPSFGPWLTWAIGLPYWLLGCQLAQTVGQETEAVVSTRRIWMWRLGVWGGASGSSILMFHAHIGYPWTMMPFGVAVFIWLRNEIAYYRTRAPWAVLEWAGLWSYSIYAMHMVLPDVAPRFLSAGLGKTSGWAALVLFVLAGCYLFYLVAEKPSHWLGRRIRSARSRPSTE